MVVTDPIADMLTRIRNATMSKHTEVDIPSSKTKRAIAQILLEEGYIAAVEEKNDIKQGTLKISLKYGQKGARVIYGLRRISKPGLRVYSPAEKLPKVYGGLGIAIISTSKGIMTDKHAREQNLGGEVLAYVW